jgi:hypothetical protein
MPRSALASWPVMFHEIWVGEDSFSCSKVTVPLTLESPRRTATGDVVLASVLVQAHVVLCRLVSHWAGHSVGAGKVAIRVSG